MDNCIKTRYNFGEGGEEELPGLFWENKFLKAVC